MSVMASRSIILVLILLVGCLESRFVSEPRESNDVDALTERVNTLTKTVTDLTRQMIRQQLFVEERIRSDADSGVKQVRHLREGTRNYYASTHTSSISVLAIHDHSNNDRTVGMGEFVAVLNGVEFRTRHNDYRLYMPHKTGSGFHETEHIPFPDVPPEVSSKGTVKEQIDEMREWFKAWQNQDHSVRDYRKYFKPVMCYMEGAWTLVQEDEIDEPFESDRHFIDAASWNELEDKIRFTSYSGRKDNLENYSYLPKIIINITSDGLPQFAQWNYRILCNPISRDIPLNRFRMVDELGPRMSTKRTFDHHVETRAARFQLNPFDEDTWRDAIFRTRFGLLDEIMSEIPGKDNYQGDLIDDAFGLAAVSVDPKTRDQRLKADRYHRWFKVEAKDAMGTSVRHRGFADENLFMALTTQPKVAGMDIKACDSKGENCKYIHQKWSYAVPLEIIYLTPLSKWNPFDIDYKGDAKGVGKIVEADGRNGDTQDKNKAFNGTHSRKFYMTPLEFFAGNELDTDLADTTANSVGVLNKRNELVITKATGTRIFFPPIDGIEKRVRQRYPIAPVHGEGSQVWKELEALKDLMLKSKTNSYVFHEPLTTGEPAKEPVETKDIKLEMASARETPPGPHIHYLFVTAAQVKHMKNGGTIENIESTQGAGHTHEVTLKYSQFNERFVIVSCDGSTEGGGSRCKDRHPAIPIIVPDMK